MNSLGGEVSWSSLLLYFGAVLAVGIAYLVLFTNKVSMRRTPKQDAGKALVDPMMIMMENNDCSKDPSESMEAHLAKTLHPGSDHWDVIVAILCSPGMIQWSIYDQQRVQAAVEKRKQELQDVKTKVPDIVNDLEDLVNSGGWDDEQPNGDDDDMDDQKIEQEERERAAKQADEERKARLENLKIATGRATVQVEGLDEGVIGQRWVESKLQAVNVWPPHSLSHFAGKSYHYPPLNRNCTPMDHPGIRRMLCIALGRLHSSVLNNHPELIAAGSQKKLDQTYFRAASEVRQRIIMWLNSALKVAAELGHPKLCQTVIETIANFKIGTHPKVETTVAWFNDIMEKTYGMAPKLKLLKQELREHVDGDPKATGPIIPPETVLPCNSQVILLIELERLHAEAFLRQKLAICQQQGINPQEALNSFREPWWFLVDGPKSMRDENNNVTSSWPPNSIVSYKVPANHLELFEKDSERVLVQITPMIIPNISQKQLAVRMALKIPSKPGAYFLRASLFSTEFLGADMTNITFHFQCSLQSEETKKNN